MTLYIVATPIGNLKDITLRALDVLKSVDGIIAEDTRHTKKMLDSFQITKPLFSFFEGKEEEKTPHLLSKLEAGQHLALVTDAGTPGVSDPGFRLVRAAIEKNISIVPIPGPSASICALQASGLPTDSFFFVGFLPEKGGKRATKLEELRQVPATLILYLSPWKAAKQTAELFKILGDRSVCMARELTKLHEELWRGTLSELAEHLAKKKPKGEITLVVGGSKTSTFHNG